MITSKMADIVYGVHHLYKFCISGIKRHGQLVASKQWLGIVVAMVPILHSEVFFRSGQDEDRSYLSSSSQTRKKAANARKFIP